VKRLNLTRAGKQQPFSSADERVVTLFLSAHEEENAVRPSQDTQAKPASNDFVTYSADAMIDLTALLRRCMCDGNSQRVESRMEFPARNFLWRSERRVT
jgi:hypothetical protein